MAKEQDLELEGSVHKIVFRSEESGYTVGVLRGTEEDVTFVGTSGAIWEGERVRLRGVWSEHAKHGRQFVAESIECEAPITKHGIQRFLASGLIKGVGSVMAERLVEAFGLDTLEVITHQPERLREVSGIGRAKYDQIVASWQEQYAIRRIMIFLQGHGIGLAQSMRIYKAYGSDAVAVVSENPYRLCRDIWGIGFSTADRIGRSLGVPETSPLRVRAGIHHVLSTISEDGHCYCEVEELVESTIRVLDVNEEVASEALIREVSAGHLVRDEGRVYLKSYFDAERSVALHLNRLSNVEGVVDVVDEAKALSWVSEKLDLSFADTQADALKVAFSSKVSVITGGPGVGKTTIIRAILEVMRAKERAVILTAPTGRAAKRMEEASGVPALTLHRLLKFMPHLNRFECNEENPVEGDVFVIDEASMIDVVLMSSVLSALPDHAQLIIVGDIDQLPSVGAGNVLRDIIASDRVPCTKLTTIFRQAERSMIVENAHRVNHGEGFLDQEVSVLQDFYYIPVDDPDVAIEKLVNLVTERIPERFGLDPLRDVQVLSPMRRGQHGVEHLNQLLQEKLNAVGAHVSRFGRELRVGDRVMQVRNNYDKDVYNGDIGRVSSIDASEERVGVDFGGVRVVQYDFKELDELTLSYVSTIHKSQGSEYPAVVIILSTQHFKMLKRNLLYTAITRGRDLICVVGSKRAVELAIRNNDVKERRTNLATRIREAFQGSATSSL